MIIFKTICNQSCFTADPAFFYQELRPWLSPITWYPSRLQFEDIGVKSPNVACTAIETMISVLLALCSNRLS